LGLSVIGLGLKLNPNNHNKQGMFR
jgi:hypothetical protein